MTTIWKRLGCELKKEIWWWLIGGGPIDMTWKRTTQWLAESDIQWVGKGQLCKVVCLWFGRGGVTVTVTCIRVMSIKILWEKSSYTWPRISGGGARIKNLVTLFIWRKDPNLELARLTMQPTLRQRIIDSNREDPNLNKILDQLIGGPMNGFSKSIDDKRWCQGHLCVPAVSEIKNEILTEAYNSPFSIQLVVRRCTKTWNNTSGSRVWKRISQRMWVNV